MKKQYIVIAQIAYGEVTECCSAAVEAKSRAGAVKAAGKNNGYDPKSESVTIAAVYEITGTDFDINLI